MHSPSTDTPTFVLLPGMDGSGQLFSAFAEALGPRVRTQVVRYPADQPWSYEQLATFVREQLPTGSPFVRLGESFSGPVAISLAATALPTSSASCCAAPSCATRIPP